MRAIFMKHYPNTRKPKEKEQSLNRLGKASKVVEVKAYSKGKITPEIAEMLSKLK